MIDISLAVVFVLVWSIVGLAVIAHLRNRMYSFAVAASAGFMSAFQLFGLHPDCPLLLLLCSFCLPVLVLLPFAWISAK